MHATVFILTTHRGTTLTAPYMPTDLLLYHMQVSYFSFDENVDVIINGPYTS
jgi:hypothetical protein